MRANDRESFEARTSFFRGQDALGAGHESSVMPFLARRAGRGAFFLFVFVYILPAWYGLGVERISENQEKKRKKKQGRGEGKKKNIHQ